MLYHLSIGRQGECNSKTASSTIILFITADWPGFRRKFQNLEAIINYRQHCKEQSFYNSTLVKSLVVDDENFECVNAITPGL